MQAHLAQYYGQDHVDDIVAALVMPPSQTTIRVNTLRNTRAHLLEKLNAYLAAQRHGGLEPFVARPHPLLSDVVTIDVHGPLAVDELSAAVLVDVGCGEAVLRGADIFVAGVIAVSANVAEGADVSVYVQQYGCQLRRGTKLKAGLLKSVGARLLGNGECVADLKRLVVGPHTAGTGLTGLGVRMSRCIFSSPALRGVLEGDMFLQNLPSAVVGHCMQPLRPGMRVLDMCAAPGGKTTHLSALQPEATIVAVDKSSRRLALVQGLATQLGARNVQTVQMSATDVLARFGAESFDAVLLDPPCSALGLRPRLNWGVTVRDLLSMAKLQRQMLDVAHAVLRPGGRLVFSTCTINVKENEENVAFALRAFPQLRLEPLPVDVGVPGVRVKGLSEGDARLMRRFDPATEEGATSIGFFIARFSKRAAPAAAATEGAEEAHGAG